ncbi:CPBP family intramembrane glutamic endopeptidase [Aneurinibacillus thermoaerophilus]|uniref:CPBP family intramembrane metalloprotease n=1 Tax=Aneurinibacillus thermoaerophilus TaxID=143495 RepID=A0ABX8YF08_ANETH|nr:type II CAAX endopeptidase family protein [Aneurinibacillus thermoaerophilus]MED0736238.1 type II CAAX endopeptidase family protein [Aneurinibacillus thermoaerophilus]MED0763245.1 type II CAAX endopeptidase family protein [Aneurinibacillus thermoaerophilus]QYY44100.1 CPBP family intramembrane metalloprotease [Aneurinibacillus thermoaerophilus]
MQAGAKKRGMKMKIEVQVENKTIELKSIIKALAIGISWSILFIIAAAFSFSLYEMRGKDLIIFSVALSIPVCLILILCVKKYVLTEKQLLWSSLGFQRMKNIHIMKYALHIMSLWLLIIITQIIVLAVFPPEATSSSQLVTSQLTQMSSAEFWLLYIVVAILVPITEEIIFRGLIYKYLCRKYGFGIATIGSALIFTMAHFFVPMLWAALFIMGCCLAYLFKTYQSIFAPLSLHILTNSINIIALSWILF